MRDDLSRGLRRALLAGAGLLLAACAAQQGNPLRPLDWKSDANGSLEFDVSGRQVVVAPPVGFCMDRNEVWQQKDAVFVLIEDCATLRAGGSTSRFDGLVSLAIGDAPLFDAQADDGSKVFAELEAFLRSGDGRATAGMGGAASEVRVVEARRLRDTLYVLVEDKGEHVLPGLGPRFWRGFTNLNGRSAIASLGMFEGSAMGDAEKLATLAHVIATLKRANGDPVSDAEARIATRASRPVAYAYARQEREILATSRGVPLPRSRPGSARARGAASGRAASGGAAVIAAASDLSPASAPLARRRPRS